MHLEETWTSSSSYSFLFHLLFILFAWKITRKHTHTCFSSQTCEMPYCENMKYHINPVFLYLDKSLKAVSKCWLQRGQVCASKHKIIEEETFVISISGDWFKQKHIMQEVSKCPIPSKSVGDVSNLTNQTKLLTFFWLDPTLKGVTQELMNIISAY